MPVSRPVRWLGIVGLYVILLAGGWFVGDLFQRLLDAGMPSTDESSVRMTIMTLAAIFVVASAIPFVPGAEIGLGLILVFGGKIALLVYSCMVVALLISFLIGRFVPTSAIAGFFGFLGMMRVRELVLQFDPLDADDRLALLVSRAPRRFIPTLLRHRYLALVVMLNVPGNTLIGGGGGLAFAAGLSGLFSPLGYITAICIGVAPIPLFFFLMD